MGYEIKVLRWVDEVEYKVPRREDPLIDIKEGGRLL